MCFATNHLVGTGAQRAAALELLQMFAAGVWAASRSALMMQHSGQSPLRSGCNMPCR